jgi:hypothetical protein
MTSCPICQHAKVDGINTALANGVAPGIIVRRYRLEPVSFGVHVAHISLERQQAHVMDARESLAALLIPPHTESRPLIRFKQAWQDAKGDRGERQRMLDWLNQQLDPNEMEQTTWGGDDVA